MGGRSVGHEAEAAEVRRRTSAGMRPTFFELLTTAPIARPAVREPAVTCCPGGLPGPSWGSSTDGLQAPARACVRVRVARRQRCGALMEGWSSGDAQVAGGSSH
jgi:hypothetical protein